MAAEIVRYGDAEGWAAGVAADVAGAIRRALSRRESVTVALPGGRSPAPILERLAAEPLPWERVVAVPTDDRVVPDDHPARNRALLARCLARAVEAGLRVEGLQATGPIRAPDVVLLGFGEDRHIASLFPGSVDAAWLDPFGEAAVVAVTPDPLPPEAPYDRLTLTMAALAPAEAVLVAAAGEGKARALEAALAERPPSTPLGILLAQDRIPVRVHIARPQAR